MKLSESIRLFLASRRRPKTAPLQVESVAVGDREMVMIGPNAAATASFMQKRAAFVEAYCKERGWTVNTLTVDQICELREQPGWKYPQ